MVKKSLKQVLNQYKDLGFDSAVIQIAYANVDGNSQRVMDQIFRLQNQSQNYPTKPANPQDEDAQLSKAIEMSMNQAKDKKIMLQPLNPQQRVRKSGVPVGLKNIGNTCYFNSLLQTYFQNPQFVKTVLSYEIPKQYKNLGDQILQKRSQQNFEFKRKLASCKLVQNLRQLFCGLIGSDRKYIDPTSVISSIVDDYGNQLSIGDQKDIGQFNLVLLSRIQQGLEQGRKQNEMQIQVSAQKQRQLDSPSKINSFGGQQGSLLKRSSIKVRQQSVIASQFIGKMQNKFINQKQGIDKTEEELFSLLFVNVKNRQLYKACQQITLCHIDDYRNQRGEVVGVQRHCWIKEAPKTLFFQLDRVTYDAKKQTLQKINDVFDFPKIFYIDPFLLKNKEEAMNIQKVVRSLRRQKQQYQQSLEKLQHFGQSQLNLQTLLGQTHRFLQQQRTEMDIQKQTDPLFFQKLSSSISPSILNILKNYKESVKQRINNFTIKIGQIDKQIQRAYSKLNNTAYSLYSLMIHQGGADSGHYYSYIFDHQHGIWRKYNDINISQQLQQQVLKQGKGANQTSAYYLVYAAKQSLLPSSNKKLSYLCSTDQGYLKDFYSNLMNVEQRQRLISDNNKLHSQIEQYKMNSFVNRVVDVYTKKFQTYNQLFRKTKFQKKKNTPPLLASLPLFVRSLDEQVYKNILLFQSIVQYGPKQKSLIFEDMLMKKLKSFNEFKRPKKISEEGRYHNMFVQNYHNAIFTRRLFECIDKQEYDGVFVLLKQLLRSDPTQYYHWLAKLLLKIFVVKFISEIQEMILTQPEKSIVQLHRTVLILKKYINKQEERMLIVNAISWLNQIMNVAQAQFKHAFEEAIHIINGNYTGQYQQLQQSNLKIEQLTKSVDLGDVMWNSSRQENTIVELMLQARDKVKSKFQACNKLYSEMKKINTPLFKQERNKILKN